MVEEAPKFPFSFERTMTKTNVDKPNSLLELSLNQSKACWALKMRKEVKMMVEQEEDDEMQQHQVEWKLRWRSGCRMRRGDRITSSSWKPFARAYKLARGDVLAFTLLSTSLLSVCILRRSATAYMARLTMIPSSSDHKILSMDHQPPSQPPVVAPNLPSTDTQPIAQHGFCKRTVALCYLKLEQSHMQGKPFLLDLPIQFREQLAQYGWGATETSAVHPASYTTLTSQALFGDEAGIAKGDLCIFELIQDATCRSTLHIYVYKKDQGQACFIMSL